jgi:hypothetical protein
MIFPLLLSSANDDGSESSDGLALASDMAVSPPHRDRKIPEFIGISRAIKTAASTPKSSLVPINSNDGLRFFGESVPTPARKPSASAPGHGSTPARMIAALGRSFEKVRVDPAKKKTWTPDHLNGRTPFNSPVGVNAPTGNASRNVAFFPQEENCIVSTPRRGGVALIMNGLTTAAGRLASSPRVPSIYYRGECPDTAYDGDVSSVESTVAVQDGTPGRFSRVNTRRKSEETLSLEDDASSPDTRSII